MEHTEQKFSPSQNVKKYHAAGASDEQSGVSFNS
jgi:hypothetical protein